MTSDLDLTRLTPQVLTALREQNTQDGKLGWQSTMGVDDVALLLDAAEAADAEVASLRLAAERLRGAMREIRDMAELQEHRAESAEAALVIAMSDHDDRTCPHEVDAASFKNVCREVSQMAYALGIRDSGMGVSELVETMLRRESSRPIYEQRCGHVSWHRDWCDQCADDEQLALLDAARALLAAHDAPRGRDYLVNLKPAWDALRAEVKNR